MTFSKKSILWTLTLSALLVGCSASVDEKENPLAGTVDAQSSALMTLSSVRLENTQAVGQTPVSRQATDKYYTIKACFTNNFGRKLRNKRFVIEGKGLSKAIKVSDESSCVYWEEHIKMDYTKAAQLTKFDRTVTLYKTSISQNVSFGINALQGDNFVRLDKTTDRTNFSDNAAKLGVNDTIVMKQIKFTPKGYGKDDPRNDNNVIDKPFVANTCFNLKANGQRMQREIIDAIMINEETGRVMKKQNYQLDESGCAEVSFSMKHERYTNTRRIPFKFIVKSKNPALKGAIVERGVCLYPWSNSGWVFGHDTISGECPEDSKDQKARIFLDEVNYTFLGHDQDKGYHLNENLDMVLVKSYVVNMYPKIDYGNFVHHMDPIEPIYQGDFRLKVLFLAPTEGDIELTPENYKKFKIISATSKIVSVEGKRLKARIDMPIRFNDIPYIHTRSYAVVRLEPIEETENSLQPAIAAGTFHASSKTFRSILHTQVDVDDVVTKETTKLVELRGFLDELFTDVNDDGQSQLISYQLGAKEARSSEQAFLDNSKSEDMDDFDNMKLSFAKEELNGVIDDKVFSKLLDNSYSYDTMKKLCGTLFDTKMSEGFLWMDGEYLSHSMRECVKNPEMMMNVNSFSHIQTIASKPEVRFSNTIRIHKGTGSNNFHGTSDRIGTSRRINAGLSLSVKKEVFGLISVGAGAGLDVSKMWGRDMQTGNSNREDTGQSIDLYADMISLEFDAITTKCVTIEGTYKYKRMVVDSAYYGSGITMTGGMGPVVYQKKIPNKKRVRICTDTKKKESLTESWYYVGEGHQFNTILRDRLSIKENKYMVMIRGKKNMAKFAEFLRISGKNIFMKKVKKTVLPDTYMQNAFSDFKSAFDKDNDLVSDMALPGTIEKYDVLGNGDDQYYGELPVENFNPLTSPFGTNNK